MKNFLAQEHEKLSLWWAAISAKEIALYLLLTFALLLPVYLYYAALGITGLTEWYRCLRSFAECGLLFFLTELVTRRSLLHPFWRIGYIPFFSWILIFPYVLTHAANGMKDASFNHLSPYFLTAMAILLLLFFVMNVISRVYVGKRLATLICLALVCFFTFNALRIHGDHDDIERNVFRSDKHQPLVRAHRALAHLAAVAPLFPRARPLLRGALREMDLPECLLSLSEVDPEEQKVLLRHSPYAAISRFLRLSVALPALGERMLPPPRLRSRQTI